MSAGPGTLSGRRVGAAAAMVGAAGVIGLVVLVTVVTTWLPALVGGALGGGAGSAVGGRPSAVGGVPALFLRLDEQAAATCPGLPWSVLAAIGKVESAFGTNDGPSPAGAMGPMQFEPATFTSYDGPVPADPAGNPAGSPSPPSIMDTGDAIYAAARYLCANGGGRPSGLSGAVFSYNHAGWYVSEVLSLARTYQSEAVPAVSGGSSPPGAGAALAFARAAIGTPYVWGGTGNPGFDCSGLTQAAWAAAGVAIPRVAEAQWAAMAHVSDPAPGDLVFFDEPTDTQAPPNHVGIYIGHGEMIDAPYTGVDVRVDPVQSAYLMGYGRP